MQSNHLTITTDFNTLPIIGIQTSRDNIVQTIDMVKSFSKQNTIKLFSSASSYILQYDRRSLDDIYREGGKSWQNLMDDIVLYYVARLVLTDTPIPLSGESSMG